MAYKGRYKIKNRDKYLTNADYCIYRSSWESALMRWCDISTNVLKWGSEIVKIPYILKHGDSDLPKVHTYIIDFVIKFNNGQWYLIEVKPEKETKPPRNSKNKYKFIKESLTWEKNKAKWKFANEYAKSKNMRFAIWTEKDLRLAGIPIN